MEIETKYEIDQRVYYLHNSEVILLKVDKIHTTSVMNSHQFLEHRFYYDLKFADYKDEMKHKHYNLDLAKMQEVFIFKNKDELIDKLFKDIVEL
jgi:hypothetical protein